jgi:uncharacterized membrane protein YeaQ/YmgE (transglycosylase-associated protein family)
MGLLVWLVIGAVVGSLAGLILRERIGLLGSIATGIVGAFIGGAVFAHGDIDNSPLTLGTFTVSLIGAVALLAIINMVRTGSPR